VNALVLIVGMHRSGTSLVASMLAEAGLEMGEDEAHLARPGSDNERGFWENLRVRDLHESILAAARGSWDSPPSPTFLRTAAAERREAFDDLLRSFPRFPAGFKDPRATLFLPEWIAAARRVGLASRVVICRRNFRAIVASLRKRDGADERRTTALVAHYLAELYSAVGACAPDLVMDVDYDLLFTERAADEFRRVRVLCGLPEGRDEAALARIDAALRHHGRNG
jgi:hypothetical protein